MTVSHQGSSKEEELNNQITTLTTEKNEQKKVSETIGSLFTGELNEKIKGLIGLTGQELEGKVKDLYDKKLKNAIEGIISSDLSEMKDEDKKKLHAELQGKILSVIETDQSKDVNEIVKSIKEGLTNSIISASKFSKEVADLKEQLKVREQEKAVLQAAKEKSEQEVKDLGTQLSNLPNAPLLKEKEGEITRLKKQAQDDKNLVGKLQKEKKELEDKNKTTEQPKQSNAARYTATAGVGLAAGLIAFIALQRTVRLDIWVMVGIAVVSTLAVGGITYAVLPSTQVNGAEAQKANGNNKGK